MKRILFNFIVINIIGLNICYIHLLPEYSGQWDIFQHSLFYIPNLTLIFIYYIIYDDLKYRWEIEFSKEFMTFGIGYETYQKNFMIGIPFIMLFYGKNPNYHNL